MTEKIMNDNILYFNEWLAFNPLFQNHLKIEENHLVYFDEKETLKQDISSFYLPEILFNENLRNELSLVHELSPKEFFNITTVYCELKDAMERENNEFASSPTIKEICLLKDNNDKEFICFIDENNRKYRYDTNTPETIINLYNELKDKHPVTLKELERKIQNANA